MKNLVALLGVTLALVFGSPAEAAPPHRSAVYTPVLSYYFNAATGSDSNNCLTIGTACASLTKVAALSPFAAGTDVIFEDGQTFRVSSYNSGALARPLWAVSNGTDNAHRVRYRTRLGGTATLAGDIAFNSGWGSTSGVNSFCDGGGCQQRTMGNGFVRENFPIVDGLPHWPSHWSLNALAAGNSGWPSAIDAFDDSRPDADSFYYCPTGQAQTGPTYDPTKHFRWFSNGDSTYTIEIDDAGIASHYGSTGPVGATLVYRATAANITVHARITGWNSGTGVLTVGAATAQPDYQDGIYWAISGHPLDLHTKGQFAWSTENPNPQTLYVAWRNGADRSVSRYANGFRFTGDYQRVSNLKFGRTSAAYNGNDTTALMEIGGNFGIIENVGFELALDPSRNRALAASLTTGSGAADNATSWTISNVSFSNVPYAAPNYHLKLYNSVEDGLTTDFVGGTVVYLGGNSNNNIFRNIDGSEVVAQHKNGLSFYQLTYSNTIEYSSFVGNSQPLTAQSDGIAPTIKNDVLRNLYADQARPVTTASPATYNLQTPGFRIDGGETGLTFDRVLMPLVFQTGVSFSTAAGANSGTLTRSAVASLVTSGSGGKMAGVALQDFRAFFSFFGGTGITGTEPWGSYGGASPITNATIAAAQWTGAPTSEIWQAMSHDPSDTSYQSVQLGPHSWNWIWPAYGTAITTLNDLGLTNPKTILAGYMVGKTVGHLYGQMPGSILSLTAGGTNFGLDRGVIFANQNLPAGSLTFTIRETNGALTHDTALTVVVTNP